MRPQTPTDEQILDDRNIDKSYLRLDVGVIWDGVSQSISLRRLIPETKHLLALSGKSLRRFVFTGINYGSGIFNRCGGNKQLT